MGSTEVAGLQERKIPYAEVRKYIQDADIFLFRGTYWLSEAFTTVMGGPYSHVGLVSRWNKRCMLLQANAPAVNAVPLSAAVSQYNGGADWHRLKPEFRKGLDVNKVLWEALADLGLPFGFWSALRGIADRVLFGTRSVERGAASRVFGLGLRPDRDHPRALFCAEYVERCFRKADASLTRNLDGPTFPKDIRNGGKVQYVGTVCHDPGSPVNREEDVVDACQCPYAAQDIPQEAPQNANRTPN